MSSFRPQSHDLAKTYGSQVTGSLAGLTSTGAAGTASIKGQLLSLEESVRSLTDEIKFNENEVTMLQTEKNSMEQVLTMQTADVRTSLKKEMYRVDEEMRRQFTSQKNENTRLQQQVSQIKAEKTALHQMLLGLQRRLAELELQVGSEDI
jgi:chromosome segregation ATPase